MLSDLVNKKERLHDSHTGREVDLHKTLRRHSGRFMHVEFTSCAQEERGNCALQDKKIIKLSGVFLITLSIFNIDNKDTRTRS